MTPPLHQLAVRIRSELKDVARVLQARRRDGARRRSSDDYYLDGVALNLHGFYGGLERLFERIVVIVDDARPAGENWHQILLQQMAQEVPGVRPAVISESTRAKLDAYRSFRHVARNVYTFNLDPAKLRELVVQGAGCFAQVQAELLAFADLLERHASP